MLYPHEEPLNESQIALLNKIYYEEKSFTGYYRFFEIVRNRYEAENVPRIYRQQVKLWVQDQTPYQLFKQPQKRVDTRSIYASQVGGMLQCDSIILGNDLKSSLRHTAIFNVIDVYSRYAWSFPQKSANSAETNANMQIVIKELEENGYKLSALQSDNGSEHASLQTVIGTAKHIFSPAGQPQRNGMVERFNKTMQSWLKQYAVSAKNPRQWFLDLENFVKLYNNSTHRSIKAKPSDVFNDKVKPDTTDDDKTVDKDIELPIPSFVRILDEKRTGIDKRKPLWSTEVYKITKIKKGLDTRRNTYYVEELKRYFNNTQLQVITSGEPQAVQHTPTKKQTEPDFQPRRSTRIVNRVPIS